MILLCIYCIPVFALTYLFLEDLVKGWFKGFGKIEVISVYILGCLLWPIGLIVGLTDCLQENMSLKRKTKKENKRKMVYEVLNEIKLK
jgi:hypothetical protein